MDDSLRDRLSVCVMDAREISLLITRIEADAAKKLPLMDERLEQQLATLRSLLADMHKEPCLLHDGDALQSAQQVMTEDHPDIL